MWVQFKVSLLNGWIKEKSDVAQGNRKWAPPSFKVKHAALCSLCVHMGFVRLAWRALIHLLSNSSLSHTVSFAHSPQSTASEISNTQESAASSFACGLEAKGEQAGACVYERAWVDTHEHIRTCTHARTSCQVHQSIMWQTRGERAHAISGEVAFSLVKCARQCVLCTSHSLQLNVCKHKLNN